MVDKEMLEAIREIVREEVSEAEQRTDKRIDAIEQRIAKSTVALMDAEFKPQFNLLAEGIQDIQDKLVPRSRVDDLEDEVKFLKSVIRQINEDVQTLKKAN